VKIKKGAAVFAALAAGAMFVLAQQGATAAPTADEHIVYRVAGGAQHAEALLGNGMDVLEERSGNDLFVLGDASTPVTLNSLGLTATVDRTITAPNWQAPAKGYRSGLADDTYYGGYHTVNAQYAHLDSVASAHADLATTVTYGQSWLKQQSRGGFDLKAICLTHKQTGDCDLSTAATKPRFFLHAQIHAREITTGDVAYRWIDYLVDNYGTNADVTALMDSTEMWVVPIANPDGVDIVQQGGDNPILQRKNADDSFQDCGTGDTGVDLNRNAGSHFGYSGSSDDPCDETFMGPSADSEPENSALETLLAKLYPDTRADGDDAAADASTKGMFITLHSDASQVIFPWGHDANVHTGNDAPLRAFGTQLGDLLGYQSGQAGEILYDSSGGTDDWTYDKLGVPAYTIEVGDSDSGQCGGFLPEYSCQDSYFWPKMQPGLMLAAQKAANPYGG
jgi:hypothetical protein